MKVALIGAGKNGAGHMRCVKEIEDIQIVGIADPEGSRAEELVAEVGGKAYTDHRAMLDAEKPEAVWISSPCFLHADHTVDCAQAGAHVMCEKPMALTLPDCDRMIAAADESNVKLMIGQSTRYIEPLVELKRIFDSGRCGDLVCAWSVRTNYHQRQSHAPWRLQGDKSGGIVFEWEIHEIDFVCSFGGKVGQVYAQTAYTREDAPDFVDHFAAILTFEKCGYASLDASQSCAVGRGGRGFVGTKGAAEAHGRDSVRLRMNDADDVELIQVEPGAHIQRGLAKLTQDGDFIRAVREDDVSPVPGEDGRANVEIGLAVVESGKTGEAVKLPLT